MPLENLCSVPFSKEQVAIAVSHSALGAGHVGIGFHSAKDGPQVLHFAWHLKLETHNIPADLQTCWAAAAMSVPLLTSKQLVAYVRVVSRRKPSIKYGLGLMTAQGSFASNASYKQPKGNDGLTCASFVVEVLQGAMVSLVNLSSWRPDPLNLAWGEHVCTSLKSSGDAHVAAVRANVNGLRLRPFEVAAAAGLGHKAWPADFDHVQDPAKGIESDLVVVCPVEIAAAPGLVGVQPAPSQTTRPPKGFSR
jgi:hypothetical protein